MPEPIVRDVARSLARATIRDDSTVPFYAPISEWVALSGISRTRTYTLLADGTLRAKHVGNATLIDIRHGLTWLAALPDAEFGLRGRELAAAFD